MATCNEPPASVFRRALQASLDKDFNTAITLFEQLTGVELYAKKAYAFSKYMNKIKECDMDFLISMADQGHASAQHSLGVCYQKGYGVPQDRTEAARWYRLAAAQGRATAKKVLEL